MLHLQMIAACRLPGRPHLPSRCGTSAAAHALAMIPSAARPYHLQAICRIAAKAAIAHVYRIDTFNRAANRTLIVVLIHDAYAGW